MSTLGESDSFLQNDDDGASSDSGSGGILGIGPDSEIQGAPTSRVQSGAAVVLLVLVIAGGALFMMRKFGVTGGLRWTEISIDYPVDASSQPAVRPDRHQKILTELTGSELVVQVPLKDLQRSNPFELGFRDREEVTDDQPGGLTAAQLARREQQRRQQEITRTFSALELNSVLSGSSPIARISGKPYRIGDQVAGFFVIRAIHGRSVELEADGQVFSLAMGE